MRKKDTRKGDVAMHYRNGEPCVRLVGIVIIIVEANLVFALFVFRRAILPDPSHLLEVIRSVSVIC